MSRHSRSPSLLAIGLAILAAACGSHPESVAPSLGASAGTASPLVSPTGSAATDIHLIKHVVVIMQENPRQRRARLGASTGSQRMN